MAQYYQNGQAHHQTEASPTWKQRLTAGIGLIMKLGLWFFALNPFTKLRFIYEIYVCCWLAELSAVTYYTFYYNSQVDFSLGTFMFLVQFMSQIFVHVIILLESLMMRKSVSKLVDEFSNIDTRLRRNVLNTVIKYENNWIYSALIVFAMIVATLLHHLLSWTLPSSVSLYTPMFWQTLPSSLSLQCKILDFITKITALNEYVMEVRHILNTMGERNLQRVYQANSQSVGARVQRKHSQYVFVVPHVKEDEDEEQLVVLKSIYSEISLLFKLINDCYGWSLLAFTLMYFIYFVFNSYGIILAMITQSNSSISMSRSIVFLMITVVLLSLLCWHCQRSNDQSRYIGCIIFKLVKPLGNKRYNDLVTDFSLQTLHQRFVITAKEFFNLNLNLLGSMVAAIVTYLVILIQFMFTEKTKTEESTLRLTTLAYLNTSWHIEPTTSTALVPATAINSLLTMALN